MVTSCAKTGFVGHVRFTVDVVPNCHQPECIPLVRSDMKSKLERLSAIREIALAAAETCDLEKEINGGIAEGLSAIELAEAIDGGPWRYLITRSGNSIVVARVEDLMTQLTQSFDALKSLAAGLRVQDMETTSKSEDIAQTRTRMLVARASTAHTVGAIRIERFLRPEEAAAMDAEGDVDQLLEEHGFSWNGGDMVLEIWTPAHQAKFELVETELRKRGMLTSMSHSQ